MRNNSKAGFVYLLSSPKTEYIKIGGTAISPMKRIREINASDPYSLFAPWELLDFRQIGDWRAVENGLHYVFREKLVKSIFGQKELFDVSPFSASQMLELIDPELIVAKPKIDRMFQDDEFVEYLIGLFRLSGLANWLDYQEAWTFSIFTSTSGGRFFTINIGLHEVAFSTYKKQEQINMVYMDSLICMYEDTLRWIEQHNGGIAEGYYKSALDGSLSVFFEGGFNVCSEFLRQPGVRRAVIAYWTESLLLLQAREARSINARHHNYNAVAEIVRRIKLEGHHLNI